MANVESTFEDLFSAPAEEVKQETEEVKQEVVSKGKKEILPEEDKPVAGELGGGETANLTINTTITGEATLLLSNQTSEDSRKSEFASQIEDAKIKSSQSSEVKSKDEMFNEIVAIAGREVKSLILQTEIDQQKVKEFLDKEMAYDSDSSPSNLSKQLVAVQMCKDQVIKICSEAHANYVYMDRTYDILLASYPSDAKSADMRRSEASLKLARLAIDCAKAERQYNSCKDLMDTLESRFKTLSRQITCVQLSIAIGEVQTVNSGSDPKAFIREIVDEQKKESSAPGSREW